jgi:hypothetical protein
MFLKIFRRSILLVALLVTLILVPPALAQVYTYNAVTADDYYVTGVGYVTGYYNSSTHVYTTTVSVYSPSGRSSTVTNNGAYSSASLSIDLEDGQFSFGSTMVGTCPQAGITHPVGGGGSSVQIKPFISINAIDFSAPSVARNGTVDLVVQVSASCSVTGNVTIGVNEDSHVGMPSYTFTQPPSKEVPCAAVATEFKSTISNGSVGTSGSTIKMQTYVQNCPVANCEAKNSPKSTTNSLTFNY